MIYALTKALHLIGVVSWFAGLLYIVRLFMYFQESYDRPEAEGTVMRSQFKIMIRRLWFGITWPAFIFTTVFGTWLLLQSGYITEPWLQLKLVLLVLLAGYHFVCHAIYKKIRDDRCTWTSMGLRIFNEVGTLLLVLIILTASLRSAMFDWRVWTGIVIFSVALAAGIKIYKRIRH